MTDQSSAPAGKGDGRELLGCTCARLRKVTRRVTQIYDRHIEPTGLTGAQFSLLAPLNARASMSIGAFADFVVTDPTTLTRNLVPLQRDGYVKIAPDPEDRRRRIVSITTKGRRTFQEALPAWRKAQEELAATLGEAGIAQLNGALVQTLDHLVK
ncbi:MAG: MarR family transcriptional regulator [Rhodospirillales bacterium]|jgi:DNA-binding MarR family transcriptional regulator|nr:MarR family transcriptional regulator [Rhodospirillales bacterium]